MFWLLFIFLQIPENLKDIVVWSFNSHIWADSLVEKALYIKPGYCKRAWFKNARIPPYNLYSEYSWIPPELNEGGALFEGGVQCANLQPNMGWPYDNEYDPDHTPPYKFPDPLFDDFTTRNADGYIRWVPNIGGAKVARASIVNENYEDFVLFWAYQQIDANVNALEFDEISGAYGFSSFGEEGEENPNEGYDDYTLGTANFATRVSVIYEEDTIYWCYPKPSASSNQDDASLAFDEDFKTYWVSSFADTHWIEIDFKRPRTIEQIYLSFKPDKPVNSFWVEYYGEDSVWRSFDPEIEVKDNEDTTLSFLVEPARALKVRFYSDDDRVWLREFMLFGLGFRQFLLKRYCDSLGWSIRDERWEDEKLVDFSDKEMCPDGTMALFNYREYLKCHNWTTNPYGREPDTLNPFNPANPFFFDNGPSRYFKSLFYLFSGDEEMTDSVINLRKRSFHFKRIKRFWDRVVSKVKDYAEALGRDIHISRNGSFSPFAEKVDYLICPLAGGTKLPTYPAPSLTDPDKTHLDGTKTYINIWRYSREYVKKHTGLDVPVVAFLDFGHMGNPYRHIGGIDEPADERAEYLKIYVPEMYATGVRFAFPVVCGGEVAWLDTLSDNTPLIEIIKEMADFLHKYKDIYTDRVEINPEESKITVNGIVPFNGEYVFIGSPKLSSVNESKVSISYLDSKNKSFSYLHIINHNWDDVNHRMIPQKNVEVEIPVRDEPLLIRLASPDFEKEDTLSFDYESKRVILKIPELRYYAVLIIEFPGSGVEEGPSKLKISYSLGKSVKFFYELPSKGKMSIRIYDKTGRVVRKLLEGVQDRGYHEIVWDGKGDRGREVCSGIYFVIFKYKGLTLKKKIVKLNRR